MRATYKSSRETCLGVKQQRERDSHQVGSVVVDQGAESQSAPERAAHVGDAHVPVAGAVRPAPALQSLDGGHRRANAAEESGLPVDAQQQQRRRRRAEGSEPERSCVLFPPRVRERGGSGTRLRLRLRRRRRRRRRRWASLAFISHHPPAQESPQHPQTPATRDF